MKLRRTSSKVSPNSLRAVRLICWMTSSRSVLACLDIPELRLQEAQALPPGLVLLDRQLVDRAERVQLLAPVGQQRGGLVDLEHLSVALQFARQRRGIDRPHQLPEAPLVLLLDPVDEVAPPHVERGELGLEAVQALATDGALVFDRLDAVVPGVRLGVQRADRLRRRLYQLPAPLPLLETPGQLLTPFRELRGHGGGLFGQDLRLLPETLFAGRQFGAILAQMRGRGLGFAPLPFRPGTHQPQFGHRGPRGVALALQLGRLPAQVGRASGAVGPLPVGFVESPAQPRLLDGQRRLLGRDRCALPADDREPSDRRRFAAARVGPLDVQPAQVLLEDLQFAPPAQEILLQFALARAVLVQPGGPGLDLRHRGDDLLLDPLQLFAAAEQARLLLVPAAAAHDPVAGHEQSAARQADEDLVAAVRPRGRHGGRIVREGPAGGQQPPQVGGRRRLARHQLMRRTAGRRGRTGRRGRCGAGAAQEAGAPGLAGAQLAHQPHRRAGLVDHDRVHQLGEQILERLTPAVGHAQMVGQTAAHPAVVRARLQHMTRALPVAAVLVLDAAQQIVPRAQRLPPRLARRQLLPQRLGSRLPLGALTLETGEHLEQFASLVEQALARLLQFGGPRAVAAGGLEQAGLLLGQPLQPFVPVLLPDMQFALQSAGRGVVLDELEVQLRRVLHRLTGGGEPRLEQLQPLLVFAQLGLVVSKLRDDVFELPDQQRRLAVDLRAPHLGGADGLPGLVATPFVFRHPLFQDEHATLRLLQLLLERVQRLLQPVPLRLALVHGGTRRLDAGAQVGQFAGVRLGQRLQLAALRGQVRLAASEFAVLLAGQQQVEPAHLLEQPLVPARLADLTRERAHLAPDFVEQVAQPQQVRLGLFQLALRLAAAGLVLDDARALFDETAQFLRVLVEDLVDHRQLDHGVGGVAHAAFPEQVAQILEADRGAVDEVLADAVARDAALDRDLVVLDRDAAILVREGQAHLRQRDRLPPGGALEDDVFHPAAAQLLGGLFAQHPADRVDDVRLAAAVRAENRRDALVEIEDRTIRERLEPLDLHALELQRQTFRCGFLRCRGRRRDARSVARCLAPGFTQPAQQRGQGGLGGCPAREAAHVDAVPAPLARQFDRPPVGCVAGARERGDLPLRQQAVGLRVHVQRPAVSPHGEPERRRIEAVRGRRRLPASRVGGSRRRRDRRAGDRQRRAVGDDRRPRQTLDRGRRAQRVRRATRGRQAR